MTANLRQAVGSLLIVGLEGTSLTALERAWLRLIHPGGIILFQRNLADASQAHALLHEAASLCALHPARCVDVEGGTVNRFRAILGPLPAARAVVAARHPALARRHGELIARAVSAFGLNATLAPVLDLALPESAGPLGTRAASAAPAEVVAYAQSFLAGLSAHGIVGCGKHFPGLGGSALDSHAVTPSIPRTSRQLWNEDLLPYRVLRAALPMVMVNHAAYPATPGRKAPAGVSRYWIESTLRHRIGYRGLVLSDDMEMGGILNLMPIEEAAIAAIRAGIDMLEICRRPELILRAYESLLTEGERSAAFRALLFARARSVQRKRMRLFPGLPARVPSPRQLDTLRRQFAQFCARVESGAPSPRLSTPVEAA